MNSVINNISLGELSFPQTNKIQNLNILPRMQKTNVLKVLSLKSKRPIEGHIESRTLTVYQLPESGFENISLHLKTEKGPLVTWPSMMLYLLPQRQEQVGGLPEPS